MTRAWYHIVVIGTDLPGLVFAALAARHGYRVAVVGHGAMSNVYRRERFAFLRRPERFYGFATSPAVSRVFGELSLAIEMRNRPQALDPTLQLALPRHRIDLVPHRRRWERELDRELPGALGALDAFERWCEAATRRSDEVLTGDALFPPAGLRGRAAYRRAVAPIEDLLEGGADVIGEALTNPRLAALVRAPLLHLSGMYAAPPSPLAVARLWTHVRGGMFRIPGGLDGLKELFLRKTREQSSDYWPDAYVEHLRVKRRKVQAVVLADRAEEIGCELVVGNIEPRQLLALVPREQRVDAFHAAIAGQQPAGWRMVVNLGVNPRVLPEGMGTDVILVGDPAAPLRGDNALWLSRPGVGPCAGGDGRPGEGVLQASAVMVARGGVPSVETATRLVDGTLAQVRRLIPWLDEHLELVDAPAIGVDPVTGRPALEPRALTPVMGAAAPMTLGASPWSAETAYKNILMCGDAMFGGLGFEGACLAALQTLARAERLIKLKRPLRGERQLTR